MSMGKRTNKAAALKARGEVLWRERAKERVTSIASLKVSEASLGKERRFTGTLKEEISLRSQQSSPPGEFSMRPFRAWAAALPGMELLGRRAKAFILGRMFSLIRGGTKGREEGRGAEEGEGRVG